MKWKKTLEEFNIKLEMAEKESVNMNKIFRNYSTWKTESKKKNKKDLRILRDNINHTNGYVMGAEKEKEAENKF